ncbi:GT-D fold domain-containing glycosyltransferase [Flavobacterium sp. WC2429]|uniref:GT-D fold domain-containing glycosyltransferase n=1 Tax=Flavobacterium sp. WC2429 TaxID=3234140 RepID=A0AB39WLF6_9FLAO
MELIKSKIKAILNFCGIYKSKEIWPKISEKEKQFLIQNVQIKSSVETIRDIQNSISNKKIGAYMRFGDGDIFLMLGKDDILHQSHKKMAKEMRQAIKYRASNIHKAFPLNSKLFGYEEGMTANMHLIADVDALKYLAVTQSFIDFKYIYTPVALHYLATFNQEACIEFLRFLKNTNPIFVGNKNLKPEVLRKLFSEKHIKTPETNSYNEIDRIERELLAVLDKNKNVYQVVVIAMGCPGRILQKRILKKGFNVYLFDFGSLLDAFNDNNTRLWIDLAGGANNLKSILNKLD